MAGRELIQDRDNQAGTNHCPRGGGPEIVAAGGMPQFKRPLTMHPDRTLASVLRSICETRGLTEGVKEFAGTYGLLLQGERELLEHWKGLLRIIRSADRGLRLKPGPMTAVDVVVTNTDDGPTFSLVPRNLFAAI